MGVENAWNPLSVAIVATVAVGLHVLAGYVGCDFVEVSAKENEALAITERSAQELANETSMGLLCDGDFYDLKGDDMRAYSRSFYYGATGVGSLCVLTAWAISTCCTPTMVAWRLIALSSSVSALASLPTFLILETYPCEDLEQSCSLSWDSYYLIGAMCLYILVTALTQFLDPPDWVSQLHHWRVPKGRSTDTDHWSSGEDEDGSRDPILTPRLETPKNRFFWGGGARTKSPSKEGVERQASQQTFSYALPPTDIEQGDSLVEEEVVSSTQESDQPPETSENWTPFEPTANSFREKDNVDFAVSMEENAAAPFSTVAPQHATTTPPAFTPHPSSRVQEPEPQAQRSYSEPLLTPPITHYRLDQAPLSPLTHQTPGSAPESPSIERTTMQDPILRHVSRASTPNRSSGDDNPVQLNDTDMTTPVNRMMWSNEESILDGVVNGDESLLDTSLDRTAGIGAPFIPTVQESRRMATQGYSVYADLQTESPAAEETGPPEYDIDELVNRGAVDSSMDVSGVELEAVAADWQQEKGPATSQSNKLPQYDIDEMVNRRAVKSPMNDSHLLSPALSADWEKECTSGGNPSHGALVNRRSVHSSMDVSLLGSDDIQAIAVEGTPIYASLLLDQGSKIPKQSGKNRGLVSPSFAMKRSLSAEKYVIHNSLSRDGQPGSKRDDHAKEAPSARNFGASLWRKDSGYDKFANASGSDEEPEDLPMTEVSFDPNEIQEVSLDKDEVEQRKGTMEKELLDDWNKMFDGHGPIPAKLQGDESGDIDDEEDRRDEEELLRLISSEDFSDESPRPEGDEKDQDTRLQSSSLSSSPDKPPRSAGKNTLRPKRRARRRRSRASGSVGSSPSLLEVTIEEETQSDLEDFNKEDEHGRSLAQSGTKAYGPDELEEITAGVQEILKRSRSRSMDLLKNDGGNRIRSLSPSAVRVSTWRSERENRASIHDPVVVSDEENDTAGKSANDFRQSRIQRLQTPEISAIARARMRRDKFFGELKHPHSASQKRTEQLPKGSETPKMVASTQERRPSADAPAHAPSQNPPAHVLPVADGDDGSNTTTPEEGIGEVGSFLMGSVSVELGDLDASLIALGRPDGREYGPDEHSI